MTKTDNKSFYKNSEKDEFFLKYYEPYKITFDVSDYYMVIPTEYDLKPGGLANELYGDPQLMWIFSVFNRDSIVDPLFDFTAGKIIRVPTKNRLLMMI